ncbi:RT0821/Lpp0805 family surface protein [Cupriavidus sp. WKF15]|uniref:RT0821/Lpp0805 family surface protein n=1 Tax=Cupriavidus sp. WKF15 TaxID=3032282 RepID=UPI0023E28DE6|nr:RT0821/Lpp0805 family surface protein [Cupriavidus sp. WKF15]WER48269.1 RT0821/Lpp0805 family surface protein [Cupriavidus sp. WKF15]
MLSRQTRRLPSVALASALGATLMLAVAAPAQAYFDNYLSGTIIGKLSKDEAASLSKSIGKALNDTADGQSISWQFPATGKRLPVEGTLTPVTSKTDRGQSCRRLKTDLKRGTAEEHWSGWFCKQKDGQWKSRQVAE